MDGRTYEDAISRLAKLRSKTRTIHDAPCTHVKTCELYLQRIGISLNDLDLLSVIHVTGTKGKGSTCALTESILRNVNIKTGLLTSPHLFNCTETIRLNGEQISKTKFAKYFWEIYDKLEKQMEHEDDMPVYTNFRTILAFLVFLREKVDVAVIEVCAGGEYDFTNVIRNTKTVGITSIGLDHTFILGNTLSDIAWQKSGIIKTGANVFSTHQYDECIPVLMSRAQQKNVKSKKSTFNAKWLETSTLISENSIVRTMEFSEKMQKANLQFVPSFNDYKFHDEHLLKEISSNPTKLLNSSLAIQLTYDWIRKNPDKFTNKSIFERINSVDDGLTLPSEVVEGLVNCFWPGRCQVVVRQNITFFIDGAHTNESLQLCTDWFNIKTQSSSKKKILIYNFSKDRNRDEMLSIIHQNVKFDEALFTPSILSPSSQAIDNMFLLTWPNRSHENAKYWSELHSTNKAQAFDCISDIFKYLQLTYKDEDVSVLVTGSLYLVGAVLDGLTHEFR